MRPQSPHSVPVHIHNVRLPAGFLQIRLLQQKIFWKEALLLSVTRIVLAGFIFGSLFSIVYSLAGGVLSLGIMTFLARTGRFSIAGVSMAGGVSHNIGQLIVAMLAVETYQVGYYLPVLLIAGLITGAVIGAVAGEVLKRIRNIERI